MSKSRKTNSLFTDSSSLLVRLPAARWKSLPITSSRARVAFRVDSRASARNYAKLHGREGEKERKNGRTTTILCSEEGFKKDPTRWNLARVENTVPWDKDKKILQSLNWRLLERICTGTQVKKISLRIFDDTWARIFK